MRFGAIKNRQAKVLCDNPKCENDGCQFYKVNSSSIEPFGFSLMATCEECDLEKFKYIGEINDPEIEHMSFEDWRSNLVMLHLMEDSYNARIGKNSIFDIKPV